MKVSQFVSGLAWASSIILAWSVAVGRVQYSGLVLGVWIFFIIIGIGAGMVSLSDTRRNQP